MVTECYTRIASDRIYTQVAEHLLRLNHALLFFCKHSSFEVWNANYVYGALDVNLIWEKAHSHKAVAPVICSLIQICFKMHQNSEYQFNFKYEVHRCTSQSSFYSWPPWVFLSEPLLPYLLSLVPPHPLYRHMCTYAQFEKGDAHPGFSTLMWRCTTIVNKYPKIVIPWIPQICLYKPLDLQCDRHLKWRGVSQVLVICDHAQWASASCI